MLKFYQKRLFRLALWFGKATTDKGYQEAKIFNKDGDTEQGLGGGICQVSSTLYNAVLEDKNLEVTERHPHSNKVPYVKKDKDAAIAYGSYDFKFINHYDKKIKIEATCTSNNVSIKLLKEE